MEPQGPVALHGSCIKYGPFQNPKRHVSTELFSAEKVSMWTIHSMSSSIGSKISSPLYSISHTQRIILTHTLYCRRGTYWKSISTLSFFVRIEKLMNANDLPRGFCLLVSVPGDRDHICLLLQHLPGLQALCSWPSVQCTYEVMSWRKEKRSGSQGQKEGREGWRGKKSLKKRKYSFQTLDISLS